jgi:hypothetical protein
MWPFSTGPWLGPVLKWHPYIYNSSAGRSPSPSIRLCRDRFRRHCCRRSPLRLRPAAAPYLRLNADAPSRLCLHLRDAEPSPPRQRAPPISPPPAPPRASTPPFATTAPGPLRLRLLCCPGSSVAPHPHRPPHDPRANRCTPHRTRRPPPRRLPLDPRRRPGSGIWGAAASSAAASNAAASNAAAATATITDVRTGVDVSTSTC